MRVIPLLMLLLTGCAIVGAPTSTPTPERDCGQEQVGPDGTGDVEGRTCLLDAFVAGEPAVFVSSTTTVEGDPIIRTYHVSGSGEMGIEHDARRDRLGSGKIELLRCNGLVSVEEWSAAHPGEPYPAGWVFIEDGCEVIGTR